MDIERICYGCFREKDPGVCPYCGFNEAVEQPFLALPLGTILNGRYMVGKVLGIGGFGITYLGFDLTLEIKVAIKEYLPAGVAARANDRSVAPRWADDVEIYQRGLDSFLVEARTLATFRHPNIVRVLRYFRANGTAYIVFSGSENQLPLTDAPAPSPTARSGSSMGATIR